jgi:hypothetical protein
VLTSQTRPTILLPRQAASCPEMNNQQQGNMGSRNHSWTARGAGSPESSRPFGTTQLNPQSPAFQPRSSPSRWQLDNNTSYRPTTRPHSPYPHGGSMPSEIHSFPSHGSGAMDQSGRLMTHPHGGSFHPYMMPNACEYSTTFQSLILICNVNVTVQESHI